MLTILSAVLFFLFYSSSAQCSSAPNSLEKITFMSLNVWSGLNYQGTFKMGSYETEAKREKRYQSLVREITIRSPDVIAINEANELPGYIQRLAKDTGYDFICHVGVSGVNFFGAGFPLNLREGDALLARKGLQLKKVGRKQLSGWPVYNQVSFNFGDAVQVLVGKITIDDKDLYLAVTHLHASVPDIDQYRILALKYRNELKFSDKEYQAALTEMRKHTARRVSEAEKLASYLKATLPADAPLVLMGDMNAEPDWPTMRLLAANGFRDTFIERPGKSSFTWDGSINENILHYYDRNEHSASLINCLEKHLNLSRIRIDFILTNEGIPAHAVVDSEICATTKYLGVHPSDHFGICSTIHVK